MDHEGPASAAQGALHLKTERKGTGSQKGPTGRKRNGRTERTESSTRIRLQVLFRGLTELDAYREELRGVLDAMAEKNGVELARGACYSRWLVGTVDFEEVKAARSKRKRKEQNTA